MIAAHLLGNHDELARQEQAALRVLPADQCLESGDVAVVDGDDRLVKDHELVARQRPPEIVFETERGHHLTVHLVVEDREAVSPHGFGSVHGGIGIAQEVFGTAVFGIPERDADADGGKDLDAVEVERNPKLFLDPFGGDGRAANVLDVLDQDDELVAAEPRDRVARPARLFDSLGDGAQQLVAGDVAEAVVDVLESVEVEEEHCEALFRRRGGRARRHGAAGPSARFGWAARSAGPGAPKSGPPPGTRPHRRHRSGARPRGLRCPRCR